MKVYFVAIHKLFSIAFHNQWDMLRQDKQGLVKEYLHFFAYMFRPKGLVLSLIGPIMSYLRPGFHPSHHENDDLVKEWEEQNQGSIIKKVS